MLANLASLVKSNKTTELWARELISIWPYTRRLGKDFWQYYKLLNETQFLSMDKLKELQLSQLKKVLTHAYTNSGFYKNLYDEYGVNINSIQSFEDFKQIPIVDKKMLRKANNLTVPNKKIHMINTSGTTGSPFQFYSDATGTSMELAAIFHQWMRIGFKPGDLRIEMRGFQMDPIRYYPDSNIIRFSIIKMNSNIKLMVDLMNRYQVPFIHGYPSAIAKFAMLCKENQLKLNYHLQGVLLASEIVYEWQVDLIREVLEPTKIIAHYGNAERVALGAWCEHSQVYHFLPLYGYVEKGTSGELIGTGFLNTATPFIRYRMTDIMEDFTEEVCPYCGRGYFPLVKNIGGRIEEYLIDEKGELIPPAVLTFPFKQIKSIKSLQIEQLENKNLIIRIVAAEGAYNHLIKEKEEITNGFKLILGSSIEIEFENVKEILLTDSCKYKWITSKASKSKKDTINASL